MEDRTYDNNLILNKVFNNGVFTVRQYTNNILNAVYSEEDAAIKVNVTNLPEPTDALWENYNATAAYASYTGKPKGCSTSVTITADTIGTDGNDISLNFDGAKTINARITEWNSANPTNTCTLTTGVGTQVPINKIIIVLTGGVVGGISTGVQTIGLECTAIGNRAIAVGYRTVASGDSAAAEGQNTTAIGAGSHAEGFETVAGGLYSHAEGIETTANGQAAHAEGKGTVASEDYTHAEGFQTSASKQAAHAEGFRTSASGESSHAEGDSTIANGQAAHAEGFQTIASGYFAHAEGEFVEAHDYVEHVGGKCNIVGTGSSTNWVATDNLFTLGNGIDSDNRSNAFQVKKNGQVIASSSVKVGADSTAASINSIGAIRYSSTANSSNCEMVMQTGASTYEWVVIKTNNW